MAQVVSNGARKITLDGANLYRLGDASSGVVGTFAIQIVNTDFVGSITVKGRSRTTEAQGDNAPFVPTVFEKLYLNGAVGDGSLVSTAITTDSLILIPASGLEIGLDVTWTSGSCTAYITPLEGAAA